MTNSFTPYSNPINGADKLAQTLFVTSSSGISFVTGSAAYTGADEAVSFFDDLNLGFAIVPTHGILLTSGDGTPELTNTSPSYTQFNGRPGDAQLDAEIQAVFPEAGATQDASILEFKVNAAAGVKSVSFDVVFGSDEFPEWSNTQFVDIAAIFVNDENVAFFGGSKSRPLSVLNDNLGYFQDNQAGGITIEYDGISNKLKVIAKVHEGVNDIKIAIADTGDDIYDSGIFVSNLQGSTLDAGGAFYEIAGSLGNDVLKAIKGINNILIGNDGKDKLTAGNLFDILFGDEFVPDLVSLNSAASLGTPEKDTFIFKNAKSTAKKIDEADVIGDFDAKDKIDISGIAGPKFDFIGKKKFGDNGDPEVRYKQFKGEDFTAIYGDKNGDGKTDFAIKLVGLHDLNANDFVL